MSGGVRAPDLVWVGARAPHDQIDERTDVFLLGGVMYEILTGHRLFKARFGVTPGAVLDHYQILTSLLAPALLPSASAPQRHAIFLCRLCISDRRP